MIHEMQESMNINSIEGSKGSPQNLKENVFILYPVSVNDSGEGLPYAPENWPIPGDKWSWKVGKRIGSHGYFLDRYMYLPIRLCTTGRRKESFASRLSLEQYIRAKFPDTDVNDFFALFSWKIPSTFFKKDDKQIFRLPGDILEHQGSELHNNIVHCKAGNRLCSSLDLGVNSISEVMFCDICCNEHGFCRDCCCILCCRTINSGNNDFGHIRCEANIEGRVCGHNCHMDCALRAYMAGTVGGSIGLDAEYYCRRCDSRTDLVLHVTKILQKRESMDSRDELEKVLRIGICVLRGSNRTSAEQLLHRIESSMLKLKNGTNLEDILKMEDDSALIPVSNNKWFIGFFGAQGVARY